MKRMKTRLICNALAVCLLLLAFAGCAAEETTVTESPASAVPATESAPMDTPAPEEPAATALPLVEETQTFTYFMAQANGFSNPLVGDAGEAKYFEELEARTNIHLDITVQPVSNASEIFSIMVAGDEVSDLIENASNYYSLTDLLADEIILDLTDLVESCMPNYQALLASNAEYAKTSTTDTGEMGMVYGYYEEGLKPEYGLVIRQDWLEELSLEQPRTYAEYHEVLTAFASEYGAGVYLQSNGFTMGNYLAAGFGVMGNSAIPPFPPFQQIDGTVYFGPAMEEMYDYIALMSQWYAEGLIDSDFMTNNNATPENTNVDKYGLFVTAITQMGDWALNSASENCTLVGAYDPVQADGDALHIRWQSELVTGEGVAISAACPEPELAAAYLDYWYSEEGYLLLNYGIEGETYTFVDGVPTYTEFVTDNPDGYTLTDMTNAYTKTRGAFLVSWERNLVAYTDAQVEAMDIWAYSDNAYAIPNSATLNTEENELYTAYYNDCITYVQETLPAFICGNLALNEETWAEYIATLESMGIQNCIDAKQSALDRFNAS